MKNKLFVLIPTLFLLASCGATDTKVANAGSPNSADEIRYMNREQYHEIISSGFKNAKKATSVTMNSTATYFDDRDALLVTEGVLGGGTSGTFTETYDSKFYSSEHAFEEIYSQSVNVDGHDYSVGESARSYEFVKTSEEATYPSYVNIFYLTTSYGNIDTSSTEYFVSETDPTETYEDSLEYFEEFAHGCISNQIASCFYELDNYSGYAYYKDGDKLVFVSHDEDYDSVNNPEYYHDNTLNNYVFTVAKFDQYVTFEKIDGSYALTGIKEIFNNYLLENLKGGLLDEPTLMYSFTADSNIEYSEKTGYQKKNFINYDYVGTYFKPLAIFYNHIPETNKTSDFEIKETYPCPFSNVTYAYRQNNAVADDTMVYFGSMSIFDNELFTFQAPCNTANEIATSTFELVDLTGGNFTSNTVENIGTFVTSINGGLFAFKIELKVSNDHEVGPTAEVFRVTVMPCF